MPDVAFKDLCIDVTAGDGRPAAVAAFWSAALEQPINDHHGEGFSLDPPPGGEKNRVVWFCEVPETMPARAEPTSTFEWSMVIRSATRRRRTLDAPRATTSTGTSSTIPMACRCACSLHIPPRLRARSVRVGGRRGRPPAIAAWWASERAARSEPRRRAVRVDRERRRLPLHVLGVPQRARSEDRQERVHWDVRLVDTTIEGSSMPAHVAATQGRRDPLVGHDRPEGNEFCVRVSGGAQRIVINGSSTTRLSTPFLPTACPPRIVTRRTRRSVVP